MPFHAMRGVLIPPRNQNKNKIFIYIVTVPRSLLYRVHCSIRDGVDGSTVRLLRRSAVLKTSCIAGAGEVECVLRGEHIDVGVRRGEVAIRIEKKLA